jgi:hypothetical protein
MVGETKKITKLLILFFTAARVCGAASGFRYDPTTRTYSIDGPAVIEKARLGLEANGTMRWANEAQSTDWDGMQTARFDFASPPLRWTVQFRPAGETLLVTLTVENLGSNAVKLGRCKLIDARVGMASDTTALILTATQYPERVVRLAGLEQPVDSKILTQWFSASSRTALQVGFVSFDRAETTVASGWDAAQHAPVVSAWSDFKGFELAPKASVESEVLCIDPGRDPYAALDHWADAVHARYQPRIWPKIPAGWLGWSWVDPLNVERYEDVVRRNVHAIRKRLPGHDIEYVWVSLGNLQGRLPGNWLEWNRDAFPSGPETLVKELESQGFHLGLWAGAFWMAARSPHAAALRDALLLYQGKPAGYAHRDLGLMNFLDPTHPETQAMLRKVFTTYRKWGVRYYMIDFMNAMAGSAYGQFGNDGYSDPKVIRGPQAWRQGLQTIRDAAGPDTYLLASSGPTLPAIGLMDAVRAGNDYGEGRALDGIGKGLYPGTFVIDKPDFWTSHSLALKALAGYFFTDRKLFLADSGNVLTVDQPMPVNEAQIRATFFGINGSPLMLGDDIERIGEERLAMIRRVLPRLAGCARPVDLFEAAGPDYAKIFDLPVETQWDKWHVLAVFNLGQRAIEKNVALESLGLDPSQRYAVWDFWNERYQGPVTGAVNVEVPAESVKLLRISRERDHPWLVSTDMHVRQGAAEILDCDWDAPQATLTVRSRRPAGEHGSLFIRAPAGWAAADPKGLWVAKDGRDGSLLVRAPLTFGSAPVEVRTRFRTFSLPATHPK